MDPSIKILLMEGLLEEIKGFCLVGSNTEVCPAANLEKKIEIS
jgi:hypothetical protein